MNGDSIPLRELVEKWFAPTRSTPAHVVHTGRHAVSHARYVLLEGLISSGPLTVVFFRHASGSWDVFPPAPETPAMCTRLFA